MVWILSLIFTIVFLLFGDHRILWESDRLFHITGFIVVTSFLYVYLRQSQMSRRAAFFSCILIAFILGFCKEALLDSYFDSFDIYANCIGIWIAAKWNAIYDVPRRSSGRHRRRVRIYTPNYSLNSK